MRPRHLLVALVCAAMSLLTLPNAAHADTVTFNFNTTFGDPPTPPPNGSTPWLVATFTDTGTNTVRLVLENFLNLTSEHAKQVYFNLESSLSPDNLSWSQVSGRDADIEASENAYKADGVGGFFDILFSWPNRNADRFVGGDTVVVDFTMTGLSASSFNAQSVPGPGGNLYVASHVGGLDNGDSTWLTSTIIPVPKSALLAIVGLLGVFAMQRRMTL